MFQFLLSLFSRKSKRAEVRKDFAKAQRPPARSPAAPTPARSPAAPTPARSPVSRSSSEDVLSNPANPLHPLHPMNQLSSPVYEETPTRSHCEPVSTPHDWRDSSPSHSSSYDSSSSDSGSSSSGSGCE